MKRPVAIPLESDEEGTVRPIAPIAMDVEDLPRVPATVESLSDPEVDGEDIAPPLKRMSWIGRILLGTAGALVSLALGLAADALIRDLFEANPGLGWFGLGVLGLFVLALVALLIREVWAVARLRNLDRLKAAALDVLASDDAKRARAVLDDLKEIYDGRADTARSLGKLADGQGSLFDGGEMIRFAERTLMAPLDAQARTLTIASARRVALVTAVSPRALVDIGFVLWESIRLGGAVARLYGARPGFWSSWRLAGAILGHLAVTGGLVLTDGVVEQLVGHGLASRVSQRLGEGVVNGLMTVRVGIAAMRVVRPLPFEAVAQPMVKDFIPELAGVLKKQTS